MATRLNPDVEPEDCPAFFFDQARKAMEREKQAFCAKNESLTSLYCAVLIVKAKASSISRFSQSSFDAHRQTLQNTLNEPGVLVSSSFVQLALALVRDEGLIWRSDRGQYEIERAEVIDAPDDKGWISELS